MHGSSHPFRAVEQGHEVGLWSHQTIIFRVDSPMCVVGLVEAIPYSNVPLLHRNSFTTSCFIDSVHMGCKATRCLHTGVIIFVNNKALILWYSKHQNMIETSTFGLKFCPMKMVIDMIEGLHYKLCHSIDLLYLCFL